MSRPNSTAAATSYDKVVGGAGGKFRKKPFRRHQATPYDRPSSVIPRNQRSNGWLLRIVDPASKIITAGANKLFASVFRKRLLPPPTPQQLPQPQREQEQKRESDINEERRDGQLEAASTDDVHPAEEKSFHDQENLKASKDGDGIATIEQILREKNFTRSELDHLTRLLQSRTIEVRCDVAKENSDTTHEENHGHHSRDVEVINGPLLENGVKPLVLTGPTSTPASELNALEDDMASPVHLAKAYMAGRSTKISPSAPGLRIQAHREHTPFGGSPFQLRSPSFSLASKPFNSVGSHENSFVMPRARGKSAIYSVHRSPYARAQTTSLHKGKEAAFDAGAGPSSLSLYQDAPIESLFSEPRKSALKRRSTVLDNDIGSLGPIRRIRQRHNLLSHKSLNLPVSRISSSGWGSDVAAAGISLPAVQSAADYFPLNSQTKGIDEKLNNLSSKHKPSKSIEMGQRILEQLDRLSPKEKLKENFFNTVSGKSTAELIPGGLHGQAHRSLETADTSKLLQSSLLNNNQSGALKAIQGITDYTNKKEDKGSGKGAKDPGCSSDKLAPDVSVLDGFSTEASWYTSSHVSASVRMVDEPPKKRLTFQMSAHEDYVELEDDLRSNGDMPASLIKMKKDDSNVDSEVPTTLKKAFNVLNPPDVDDVARLQKNPVSSELKLSPISVSNKNKELEHAADSASITEINMDSTIPTAPASSSALFDFGKPAVVSQASESSKEAPSQQLNTASFAFGSPVPSLLTESSRSMGTKSELSSRFATVASTPVVESLLPEPDKIDDKNYENAVDISSKGETAPSPSATGLAASTFSFKIPGSSPLISEEAVGTTFETASAFSQVLFSNNSTNPSLCNGFTWSTPSRSATAVTAFAANCAGSEASPIVAASSSGVPVTSPAPLEGSPIFKFGASEQPASYTSQTSTSLVTELIESELKRKGTGYGNQSSPSFSAPSSVTANANNGLFGYKFSTSENGGSLLDSSTPTFNPFSSGSVLGSSAGMSGTFGSSWQSSNPPLFNSTFNSSPALFSVGTSDSAPGSASTSSPMVFGATGASSSPSFSFGHTNAQSPVASSQLSLGNTNSIFTFGVTHASNSNDQMNMVDSMAEDSVQVPAPSVPDFSQSPMAMPPLTGFNFSATPPQVTNPFQFSGQPNMQGPVTSLSPFQPSGSLESNPGSFSLGTGGNDKSNRRIIKVRKTPRKR